MLSALHAMVSGDLKEWDILKTIKFSALLILPNLQRTGGFISLIWQIKKFFYKLMLRMENIRAVAMNGQINFLIFPFRTKAVLDFTSHSKVIQVKMVCR